MALEKDHTWEGGGVLQTEYLPGQPSKWSCPLPGAEETGGGASQGKKTKHTWILTQEDACVQVPLSVSTEEPRRAAHLDCKSENLCTKLALKPV